MVTRSWCRRRCSNSFALSYQRTCAACRVGPPCVARVVGPRVGVLVGCAWSIPGVRCTRFIGGHGWQLSRSRRHSSVALGGHQRRQPTPTVLRTCRSTPCGWCWGRNSSGTVVESRRSDALSGGYEIAPMGTRLLVLVWPRETRRWRRRRVAPQVLLLAEKCRESCRVSPPRCA